MGGVNSSMGLMLEQSTPLGTSSIFNTKMIVTSMRAMVDSIKHRLCMYVVHSVTIRMLNFAFDLCRINKFGYSPLRMLIVV